MQNRKPHRQKAPQTGHSIFGTILFSLLAVLAVEILLLTFTVHATRLGPQLNQNAEDILAMQVDNRSRYLQSILHNAQELTSLSDAINGLTQQLLDEGEISLSTLDSSSDAAYPLLEAAAPELISTLRIKSVTGVFLILNTHDLDKRKQDSRLPAIYLRDLDPDAAPSQRNADLTFVRAPAQLVQSLSIATDNSWSPTIRYRALGNRGFLYPPFQAAYKDGASLAASDYGHWTSRSYPIPGDTHEAIAYSQPLILPDGTVYGVIGVELLADYLWENLPCSELQNNGTYFLAVTGTEELSASELQLRPVLRSHCDGQPGSADESLTLRLHSAQTRRYLFSDALYIASVSPLNLYSRNAPFSGEHWLLVGSVPAVQLFAFAQRLQQLLSFIILITLAVGFVCSWLISRRLARPVAKLSAEVAAAEADSSAIPHLSTTGIRELDQFSSAFTQLSKDVLDSSTRFLRIMKLASAELGGYELRDDSVYVTDNFFSMLGLAQEQPDPLTPKAFRALMGTLEQRWFYRLSPANNKVFAIPQPDGSTHYITLRVTHILGESASEVGLAEDMTTTVPEQQRIEHERDYDTLTGLYRRRAFDRACEALFQQPEKLGCAALLMMDLDNLKQINDTYGHDWGDQYIRQTGQCFAANIPKNTVCSRRSGDEFLLLFYGYDTQDAIRAELDKLSAALRASCSTLPNGKTLNISISGGVAWYPEDGKDLKTLKKYADFAMYQVKQSRKGQVGDFDIGVYHREEYAAQTQREFLQLLREEQVYYYFQPIFSAQTGRVVAYEALMRVNTPTLTSPSQVMALAHELDRLYDIERITMFHSSEAFEKLQSRGLIRKDALLFVNSIANVNLNDEDIQEYHRRYPDLLKQLVVEITEQEDLDRACLERKRNIPGFSGAFALDDYGTGYSNELNLLELSPRYIKIDISIIRGIEKDPDKQQIVSNIVAYAHARSMQILAEGIEDEIQLRKVIDLGVDLLQGYYLSRPAAVPSPIASEALDVIRAASAAHSDAG
jgi:diguanylate cyclase (GGDEF)-like protein